jgi:hypothetical protein
MAKKVKKKSTKGLSKSDMSFLYKSMIKKGFSHKEAYKTVGSASRVSKTDINSKGSTLKKSKYKYLDFDGDGKVNKYDCRPYNKKRQDNNHCVSCGDEIFTGFKYCRSCYFDMTHHDDGSESQIEGAKEARRLDKQDEWNNSGWDE